MRRGIGAFVPGWPWFVAGVVVATAISAFGLALDQPIWGSVVIGAFVAAAGASVAAVLVTGVYCLALVLALGAVEGVFGDATHVTRVVIVAAGTLLAAGMARFRSERDAELIETRAAALAAQRTRIALDAGAMGTWVWNRATDSVVWDEHLESLFGLGARSFPGTFAAWAELVHPDDRARVLDGLTAAIDRVEPFRFDHRVVWPDGTVRWIEGRGEPVVDDAGIVTGAAGVAINIDARHRAEVERASLLDAEREARAVAEHTQQELHRLAEITTALAAATSVDEVAVAMVHHGAEALGAHHGWFGLVDTARGAIVTRAHTGYEPARLAPYHVVEHDDPLPAAEVWRTGAPVFVESPDDRRSHFPQIPDSAHGAFVVVPVQDAGVTLGVLAFSYAQPRRFDAAARSYVVAVVDACAQALRRATLFHAREDVRARLRTLLDASEALSRLDDPNAVLTTTVRLAALRIGRFASIYRVLPDGSVRRAAIAHADPMVEPVMHALAARGISAGDLVRKVAESNEPMLLTESDPTDDVDLARDPEALRLLDLLRPSSQVIVPMRISGRTMGVLLVGDDRPVPLGPSELELTADLGRRAASALERAELWQASQEALEAEHRMVQVLQRSIVPERLPEVDGVEFGAVYRPADVAIDVGGDWYDVFTSEGRVVVVVGDVAGHGVEAAALMGRVRNAIRAYAVEDLDPSELLRRTDAMLVALDQHAMVTAIVAVYDPATGELVWSRAGHPPALLCAPSGTTRFLEDVNATPLGTLSSGFATRRITLEPGALLLLYTDGLIERRDANIDDGLAWLAARAGALRARPVQALCRLLADDPFVPLPSGDDICVLALRAAPA